MNPKDVSNLLGRRTVLGLSDEEVIVLLDILDHKWDERMPFPSVPPLAKRAGKAPRTVRELIAGLEPWFLKREARPGHSNEFDLSPLFALLSKDPGEISPGLGRRDSAVTPEKNLRQNNRRETL